MKKTIICAVVSLLAVLPSFALEERQLTEAVFREESVGYRSAGTWNVIQQQKFPLYLELAKITLVGRQRLQEECLGTALYKSITRKLQEKLNRALTRDEERAVLYALHAHIKKSYCSGLWTKKEYEDRYSDHIDNEQNYVVAYEFTAEQIYIAVRAIANEDKGYEKWLQDVIGDVTRRPSW